MDLSELREARNGLPNEQQAARKIAIFAAIPAAIIGLLVGTQLVGLADPVERFLWVCIATATGAAFGIAYLVLAVYYLLGFRCVAVLSDALAGGFVGLLLGEPLFFFLNGFNLIPIRFSLWPLLVIPFCAIAFPAYEFWRRSKAELRK